MLGSRSIGTLTKSTTASARDRWSEQYWIYLLLLVTDVTAISLGFGIAYLLRFQTRFPIFHAVQPSVDLYRQLVLVFIPVWLIILVVFKLYDFYFLFGGTQEYARVFNACTTGMMLTKFAFLQRSPYPFIVPCTRTQPSPAA